MILKTFALDRPCADTCSELEALVCSLEYPTYISEIVTSVRLSIRDAILHETTTLETHNYQPPRCVSSNLQHLQDSKFASGATGSSYVMSSPLEFHFEELWEELQAKLKALLLDGDPTFALLHFVCHFLCKRSQEKAFLIFYQAFCNSSTTHIPALLGILSSSIGNSYRDIPAAHLKLIQFEEDLSPSITCLFKKVLIFMVECRLLALRMIRCDLYLPFRYFTLSAHA